MPRVHRLTRRTARRTEAWSATNTVAASWGLFAWASIIFLTCQASAASESTATIPAPEYGVGLDYSIEDLRHELLFELEYETIGGVTLETRSSILLYEHHDDLWTDLPRLEKENELGEIETLASWEWFEQGDFYPGVYGFWEITMPLYSRVFESSWSEAEELVGFGLEKSSGPSTLGATLGFGEDGFKRYQIEYEHKLSRRLTGKIVLERDPDLTVFNSVLEWFPRRNVAVYFGNESEFGDVDALFTPKIAFIFYF